MVLRLKDVRDKVEIIREHALTTKPMMIDLMIIKKDPTAVIDDVIAHGWRTFNIGVRKLEISHISDIRTAHKNL